MIEKPCKAATGQKGSAAAVDSGEAGVGLPCSPNVRLALKQALFDRFDKPPCVCRAPTKKEGGNLSATIAMIVCEPTSP